MSSRRKKGRSKANSDVVNSAQNATTSTVKKPSLIDQMLPPKQASLFKSIVRCYEIKHYKKGIKTADMILKKHPTHGETMAMKGLILNCLTRREEALELVKSGLRRNIKSHVCWHVFGLIHRSNRNYGEAIKCYLNALRIDSDNVQILRDLALLQIQMRDLNGFQETRRMILMQQSSSRLHWIAYCVGSHLNGNLKQALSILDKYESTIELNPEKLDYEVSEMLLYKNEIIEQLGDFHRALQHMTSISPYILDKLALRLRRGFILLKIGAHNEALSIFESLIDINPDHTEYHRGFCLAHGFVLPLTNDSTNALLSTYDMMTEKWPQSIQCRLIPLDLISGDIFRERVDIFLQHALNLRGMTSLPQALRSVLAVSEKRCIVQELLSGYIVELNTFGRFTAQQSVQSAPEYALLWTLFCVAHIADMNGDSTMAFELAEEILKISPDDVDVQLFHARLFKHVGAFQRAHEIVDRARLTDLGDRYLNTKCVRMSLRAGLISEAETVVSLFLRDDDKLSSLYDMHCMWFELAAGESYVRKGELGQALKKFVAVEKHFDDIHEDQFDFHAYCLRKMTLRAYVRMLAFEDTLRGHRFYVRAAKNAVRVYLQLHKSSQSVSEDDAHSAENLLNEPDKRRAVAKARREARRRVLLDKKDQDSSMAANGASTKQDNMNPVDKDPTGALLAATKTPLEEATRFMRTLQHFSSEDVEVHLLATQLYKEKQRPLLVVSSLRSAWLLTRGENERVQVALASFFLSISLHRGEMSEIVANVLEMERSELLGGLRAHEYTETLLQKKLSSEIVQVRWEGCFASAQLMLLLDYTHQQALQQIIKGFSCNDFTYKLCENAREYIISAMPSSMLALFDIAAANRFPYADMFCRRTDD